MAVNTVAISGNLTRDPELRQAGGVDVLNFSIAVNERRKDRDTGEWGDYPNYIDCVLFGSRAGALSNYLQKGTRVAVSGSLRQDRWNDRETGKARSKVEVVVDDVEFMSRRETPGGRVQVKPADLYSAEEIPF